MTTIVVDADWLVDFASRLDALGHGVESMTGSLALGDRVGSDRVTLALDSFQARWSENRTTLLGEIGDAADVSRTIAAEFLDADRTLSIELTED